MASMQELKDKESQFMYDFLCSQGNIFSRLRSVICDNRLNVKFNCITSPSEGEAYLCPITLSISATYNIDGVRKSWLWNREIKHYHEAMRIETDALSYMDYTCIIDIIDSEWSLVAVDFVPIYMAMDKRFEASEVLGVLNTLLLVGETNYYNSAIDLVKDRILISE